LAELLGFAPARPQNLHAVGDPALGADAFHGDAVPAIELRYIVAIFCFFVNPHFFGAHLSHPPVSLFGFGVLAEQFRDGLFQKVADGLVHIHGEMFQGLKEAIVDACGKRLLFPHVLYIILFTISLQALFLKILLFLFFNHFKL
jgi:hypothetical protein